MHSVHLNKFRETHKVGHGLEPVKHCFSWQGRWRAVGSGEGVVGGVGGEGGGGGVGGVGGEGGEGRWGRGGVGGEGDGGWAWMGARKTFFSWQALEGGGGWAWTEARKTLLFMAGALEGGGGKCERWGGGERCGRRRGLGMDWSPSNSWQGEDSAGWAVRAAGVGHGLEPVKHCFSWHGCWRGGGASASGGGVGAVRAVCAVWAVRAAGVGFMAGALEGGGGKCERWKRWGRWGR